MFNFQDLGSLNRFAVILFWPLGAAAVYATFGVFMFGELPEKADFLYKPAFVAAFIGQAVICALAVELIDIALHMGNSISSSWLKPIFGMILLTVGLLPLNAIGNPSAELLVSPLWAFLCLAWGLRIYMPAPQPNS